MPRYRPACRAAVCALRIRLQLGQRQCEPLAFGIIAAVINHAASVALPHFRGVWHLGGGDQVAAADFIARQRRCVQQSCQAAAP